MWSQWVPYFAWDLRSEHLVPSTPKHVVYWPQQRKKSLPTQLSWPRVHNSPSCHNSPECAFSLACLPSSCPVFAKGAKLSHGHPAPILACPLLLPFDSRLIVSRQLPKHSCLLFWFSNSLLSVQPATGQCRWRESLTGCNGMMANEHSARQTMTCCKQSRKSLLYLLPRSVCSWKQRMMCGGSQNTRPGSASWQVPRLRRRLLWCYLRDRTQSRSGRSLKIPSKYHDQ